VLICVVARSRRIAEGIATGPFFVAQSLLCSSIGLIGYDIIEEQSSYTNSLGYEITCFTQLHSWVQATLSDADGDDDTFKWIKRNKKRKNLQGRGKRSWNTG